MTTFEAIEIAMGQSIADLAAYFDTCRRKRNQVDYDRANAATDSEVKDLLVKAYEFRELVEKWIYEHHSDYAVPLS